MPHYSPSRWAAICIGIAAAIHFALGFCIEFSVDEAHYALYAQHLAWSYFDHPPLVGWIQWPLIQLTSTEGIIRIIPELLWVISAYLVFQVTVEVHHLLQGHNNGYLTSALPAASNCGLMAVLAIIAAPLPHILAIGLLPDSLLTPLSLGLMMMALRWHRQAQFQPRDWLITGMLLGLAGLSKYTGVFAAFALLLAFLSAPQKRLFAQSGFWLAVLIASLCITPVLYWNWLNDWASFKYQIAHGGGSTWAWRRVAAFLGIQIACFGPLMLLGAWIFLKNCLHHARLPLLALLGFFAIPFAIFAALSGGGGLPHWTTPAWFCLAPFVGIGLAKAWSVHQRLFIRALLIIQVGLCLLGFGFVLAGGISGGAGKSNPIADLYGWKLAGSRAAELATTHGVAGIAVQNWTLGSRAAWYASPLPVFILDQRQDQFDLWSGKLPPGANVLLINWSGMSFDSPAGNKPGFESCEPLEHLQIDRFGRNLSHFDFSLCRNWQN